MDVHSVCASSREHLFEITPSSQTRCSAMDGIVHHRNAVALWFHPYPADGAEEAYTSLPLILYTQ